MGKRISETIEYRFGRAIFSRLGQLDAHLSDDVQVTVEIQIYTDGELDIPSAIRFGQRLDFFGEYLTAGWGWLLKDTSFRFARLEEGSYRFVKPTWDEAFHAAIEVVNNEMGRLEAMAEAREFALLDAEKKVDLYA